MRSDSDLIDALSRNSLGKTEANHENYYNLRLFPVYELSASYRALWLHQPVTFNNCMVRFEVLTPAERITTFWI